MLPEGAGRDSLVILALCTRKRANKRVWRWPDIFSFESKSGMRRGRILPELEDQLESARISGSAQMRNPPDTGGYTSPPLRNNKRTKREKEVP